MSPELIKEFREAYNCLLNTSNHQYGRPIVRPIGIIDQFNPFDQPTVQVEPGIDITLMKDQLHILIADAREGREHRRRRRLHPAAAEAYQQYLTILALTDGSHNI